MWLKDLCHEVRICIISLRKPPDMTTLPFGWVRAPPDDCITFLTRNSFTVMYNTTLLSNNEVITNIDKEGRKIIKVSICNSL